jgi:RNA recognition motif-containing protein
MASKLYVGNLSWTTTNDSLAEAFAAAGTVVSARVITDRETGKSKGFGFVEMASAEEAAKAVESINGKDIDGRQIRVSEAREREERPRGSFRPRGDR